MVDYFLQGGGFMWPILIAGVAGIAFSLERLYHLLKGNINVERFTNEVAGTLKESGVQAAIAKCDQAEGPVGTLEMASLEKNMAWISFFIGTAPMLGFLGTVVGMIRAFNDIKAADDISPAVVAGGISIALLTTAFGLIVAVVLQFFQNVALNMIESHVVDMEKGSEALVETIMDLEREGKLKT